MSLYRPFFNGKYGVADLTTLSAYTLDLPPELFRDFIGGASLNARILSEYESDSLVFGTGPLTGSFAPASALLVGTFRSPRWDHLCHVPFMLRSGPEMKFSGIDVLVIRGAAKEPCIVHVGRGQVHVLPVADSADKPVPELLQMLRQKAPAFRASIVTGPAADRNSPFASASIGGHGSLDRAGLASRMAAKNLKAVLFNGIEGLPFRDDHPALARAMGKMIQASVKKGFSAVVRQLEDGAEAAGALRGKLGRNRACYHCPTPCMTHANLKSEKEKDGLLLMDHVGWAALSHKSETALPLLRRCLELGLDPLAAAHGLREDLPLREALHAIEALTSSGALLSEDDYPSARGIATRTYRLFGGGIAPLSPGDTWTDRVAAALILGICPLFVQIAGRMDRSDVLRFVTPDAEAIKSLAARLDEEAHKLLEGKIPDSGNGSMV
jgi:aldehyde:ferredoxin oxidoreductase